MLSQRNVWLLRTLGKSIVSHNASIRFIRKQKAMKYYENLQEKIGQSKYIESSQPLWHLFSFEIFTTLKSFDFRYDSYVILSKDYEVNSFVITDIPTFVDIHRSLLKTKGIPDIYIFDKGMNQLFVIPHEKNLGPYSYHFAK